MHKQDTKTEYVKHTRNASGGRRGVNKANRRAGKKIATGAVSEVSSPPRKRTSTAVKQRYVIDRRSALVIRGTWCFWREWSVWRRFRTKEARDNAIAGLLEFPLPNLEWRPRDL